MVSVPLIAQATNCSDAFSVSSVKTMDGLCGKCKNCSDDLPLNVDATLHKAATSGHAECVRTLIQAGADVNSANNDGLAPLMEVVRTRGDNVECVNALVQAGADVNANDVNGFTPLMFAARNGHDKCVNTLIEAGAAVNKTNRNGRTALMNAVTKYSEDKEVVKALKEDSEEVRSSICEAAKCGCVNSVGLLLKVGADVNAKDTKGYTALMIAASNADVNFTDLKRYQGPFVSSLKKRYFPLMFATLYGRRKCIELFISAGANVSVTNHAELPLLGLAATNGYNRAGERDHSRILDRYHILHRLTCVRHLLKAGAKVNTVNNQLLRHIFSTYLDGGISMLLFAAGFQAVCDTNLFKEKYEQRERCLKHLCREAIRKHLLNLDPHEHLFGRVPRLGLPKSLTEYLLYDVSC